MGYIIFLIKTLSKFICWLLSHGGVDGIMVILEEKNLYWEIDFKKGYLWNRLIKKNILNTGWISFVQ